MAVVSPVWLCLGCVYIQCTYKYIYIFSTQHPNSSPRRSGYLYEYINGLGSKTGTVVIWGTTVRLNHLTARQCAIRLGIAHLAACPRSARGRLSVALPDPDVPFFRGALLTLDAQERRGQEQPTRGFTNLTRGAAAGLYSLQSTPSTPFPAPKSC